ncbi:hypothetical protein, partial [Burkholderia sp. Ac-20384]|uniref:hypothetical protein n=1 Tax=Burkholderia sp. Ac-20384 TaxID=2703902 RepID=UPI00197FEA55
SLTSRSSSIAGTANCDDHSHAFDDAIVEMKRWASDVDTIDATRSLDLSWLHATQTDFPLEHHHNDDHR